MKKLIVGSLIALAASQAAGCIITSGDDTEDAFISATWKITHLSPDMNIPCPPGFDTAALVSKSINGADCDPDAPGTDTCIELFDCAAGAGISAPLIPNVYQSWIQIQNNAGSVYATSLSATVDVVAQDKSFDAQILENGGYFQLTWNLIGAQSNQALSCGDAPGGIDVTGTVTNSTEANSDVFDCDDFGGITAGYAEGSYTVSVSALDASDRSLGSAPAAPNKIIQDKNRVTNLGNFMIPISGL